MDKTTNPIIHYLIIVVVCLFAFFVNNQVIPADLMEARNLATAQEMVREGNYLVPTMNGELRLEKPPLPTWVAAAIENIFPGNLIIQRYVAGCVATIMVFFLYFLAFRLTRKREIGLFAALILATTFNIVLMGRTATWDIYCHSCMLGAVYFIVAAFQEKGAQWFRFMLAGLLMGLSFLGKGPVSFYAVLLPFLISFIIIYRPVIKGKLAPVITMVLICIAVSAWWTLYILMFHSDMALAVASKESSSWINYNVRPWYYYWQFPAEAGIWAFFWITSLIWFYWKNKIKDKKVYIFSIVWTFATLILLSVIPEKKTRYLLPLLIPGAINISVYIYYCAHSVMSGSEKTIFRINASIIALILFAMPFGLYLIFYEQQYIGIPLLAIISILSIILGIYMLKSIFGKESIQVRKVFLLITGVMILVESLCLIPVGKMFINDDHHSIRELRNIARLGDIPFYYIDAEEIRMELVYETGRIIRPMDITDDDSVYPALPFVLVSAEPVDSIFAGKNLSVQMIDIFDNNWRKPGSKRYNKNLVRHVYLIQAN